MSDEAVTWHYGLMAERWAESIHETPELPFFQKAIARFGQPVLDVGCGTGRLLLPLLQAGVDIDGCDISGDMLDQCRSRATRAGLAPQLYQQPMHAFDLPRRYRTIYICGSIGLAGSRDDDLETLRRCYQHLETDGALLLNIQAEYLSPETWNLWMSEPRRSLPQAWPEQGSRRLAADGSENVAYFRFLEIDPLEQCYTKQVRLEKWQDGELVAAEEYTLRENIYFKHEMLLLLKVAGFRTITVYGNYTDDLATADHEELVFIAIK